MINYEAHSEQRDTIAARFLERSLDREHIAIFGHLTKLVTNDIVIQDRLVLHSDNGGPMKGQNMLAKLESLGITASYSRPMQLWSHPLPRSNIVMQCLFLDVSVISKPLRNGLTSSMTGIIMSTFTVA